MTNLANDAAVSSATPKHVTDLAQGEKREHSPEQAIALMGRRARAAQAELRQAGAAQKSRALAQASQALREHQALILAANAQDVSHAQRTSRSPSFIDRLALTEDRIAQMATGVLEIAQAADPVGAVVTTWTVPSGLEISRVRVPIGVIGMVYEARPNVAADASALSIRAGNVVILRGGSDSYHSSIAISEVIRNALVASGLPADCVQIVRSRDRDYVGALLRAHADLDVVVPRGGKSLVQRVLREAQVPVFAHLEGICHTYIDASASIAMARDIVVNAKLRRPSICGATETILLHQALCPEGATRVLQALLDAGCEVRADAQLCALDARVRPAQAQDYGNEFGAAIVAAKVVADWEEAAAHIATHGSAHTEAIVAQDAQVAAQFCARVDSAIVMHNASTQFADGGEFGMGAEIGIATGRLHARGPVGAEQLTTFKYIVRGTGQTRP